MRAPTRIVSVVALVALALMVTAPAAGAQAEDEPDNIVVLTGRAEVRSGETVDNVFIADGPVVVDGTVKDALVAINGDVLVRGTAREDVVAFDGRVVIADGGHVEGDVISRHRPVVEAGGRLDGSWERWKPRAWTGVASVAGWLAVWLAFSISTLVLGLVLGLLAPRAAAAVDDASRSTGPVILWGLILLIGLPIVAVLAMVTLVGLPLGFALLFALGLIYGIGYTAGAWILGRRVVRRGSPIAAFLAGWGILRPVALVPFLGGLVWLAATVVGLGAIVVAGRRSRVAPAAVDDGGRVHTATA
ncbi:MAG TPA: polymer-forming cytoskeletal protein [Acidimicrobiales bacterium]|jgi:hypothetical protein|nr:polymer-forming cytoskeletal protein [Acidimicrobiales bacterium]